MKFIFEAEAIKGAGCKHFLTFVNRLGEYESEELKELQIKSPIQSAPVYFLPEVPELDTQRLQKLKRI